MKYTAFISLSAIILTSLGGNHLEINTNLDRPDKFNPIKDQLLTDNTEASKSRTNCRGEACRGNGRREILTS